MKIGGVSFTKHMYKSFVNITQKSKGHVEYNPQPFTFLFISALHQALYVQPIFILYGLRCEGSGSFQLQEQDKASKCFRHPAR